MFERLIAGLERRDELSDIEKAIIEGFRFRVQSFDDGQELVAEGSRPSESCLVLTGFTARAQFLSDGARQISAVHVPGDFVDLHCFLLKTMDHSIVAIRQCTAAYIPHSSLREAIAASPHLGRLFWLATLIDAAIQRAWISSIGRRTPAQHIGHLLCELHERLDLLGLVKDGSFEFPPTQTDISDMVGLSLVHVNRTIQELRAKGLVAWSSRVVTIPDLARLKRFADFDPSYLNLVKEPR
ncbi:Crp/Fnr family transcriptional regulator [Mesorhizobium sp. BAC0120]|uniref:Crp/Fnr family transcriptional regulator n=1 Tax=Mesorhizobium sp. BAC0120 TaxID=3090670 RepID=UPI00298D4CB0|nr:Crp/Fnr family transcriptional regulator [Mesorhizobium sp. BAC0120]MDW6025197.1 Crp/Fnr family transcriptional regulator [Mesorhizobium sp. BAC0120]